MYPVHLRFAYVTIKIKRVASVKVCLINVDNSYIGYKKYMWITLLLWRDSS